VTFCILAVKSTSLDDKVLVDEEFSHQILFGRLCPIEPWWYEPPSIEVFCNAHCVLLPLQRPYVSPMNARQLHYFSTSPSTWDPCPLRKLANLSATKRSSMADSTAHLIN
jgi:hypothetical protein